MDPPAVDEVIAWGNAGDNATACPVSVTRCFPPPRMFTNHGFRKVRGIVSIERGAKKLATSAARHASKNGAQLAISHSRKSSGQKGFVALRLACAVT